MCLGRNKGGVGDAIAATIPASIKSLVNSGIYRLSRKILVRFWEVLICQTVSTLLACVESCSIHLLQPFFSGEILAKSTCWLPLFPIVHILPSLNSNVSSSSFFKVHPRRFPFHYSDIPVFSCILCFPDVPIVFSVKPIDDQGHFHHFPHIFPTFSQTEAHLFPSSRPPGPSIPGSPGCRREVPRGGPELADAAGAPRGAARLRGYRESLGQRGEWGPVRWTKTYNKNQWTKWVEYC